MKSTNLHEKAWAGPSPIELLEHPDPTVRLEFVHGLALEGSLAHLPLLMKALDDSDPMVRGTASQALSALLPDFDATREADRIAVM